MSQLKLRRTNLDVYFKPVAGGESVAARYQLAFVAVDADLALA